MLKFVSDFVTSHYGMAPTVRECAAFFGKSESTLFAHLAALQRKGFLRRTSQARSILLREPAFAGVLSYLPLFQVLDAEKDFADQNAVRQILAVLPKTRNPCFAVKMADDSLHGIGIFEEDLVVAEWRAVPEAGDLVVTVTSAGIRVKRFEGGEDRRLIFGVVLSIQRFYR
ncbi:MAG: hypothetical protein MJ033_00100 [Victivallaceae bacterium]|nr:hypothetical protein [Victivallaceae bacterium]